MGDNGACDLDTSGEAVYERSCIQGELKLLSTFNFWGTNSDFNFFFLEGPEGGL